MSAGFRWAGSLTNAAPVVRKLMIAETMWQGALVQAGIIGGLGGHIQLADVANETKEDDKGIIGILTGVVDGSRSYNSTYYGDTSTYTVTQSVVADTGPAEGLVTLIIPHDTLIWGPIFAATFGTALTELTVTTASSGGVLVTDANNAVTNIADDLATVYCRQGANRGIYRVCTTTTTTVQTVTVPFPNGVVVGDKFVVASCVLGLGGLDIPATANCIDGNNDMNAYYQCYYHELNLEISGKESAVFSLTSAACALE